MKRLIFLIWLMMIPVAHGDFGYSVEGNNAEVTLVHTSGLDSAWVIFTYNSSRYDSIKLVTAFGAGSRYLEAFGLDLDSIGTHNVEIRMFTGDAFSDTLLGVWLHENPNLITTDNIGINWADVDNPTGSTPDVNVGKISGDGTAADSAELVFKRADHSYIIDPYSGTDSLMLKRIYLESADGHALHAKATGTGFAGIFGEGSDGTDGDGIRGDGTGTGEDFAGAMTAVGSVTGNVDGSVGSVAGNVDGSVASVTAAVVASDTVTTGDTIAVKKDSLIYQGSASGLSAATIWQYEIRDDTTDGAVDDTSAADHLYSASLGGGGGIGDSTIARIDSILASTGDSLETHVGRDGLTTTTVGLHMKVGGYSGVAGSPNNIKDHISSIGGGAGNRLCSLFVSNASGALGSGRVRMTSGATTYQKPISGDGFAVFNVDDATWTVLASVSGNTQDTIPQTIVITADVLDTVTMTAFTPSQPSDTGKVVLYVWTDSTFGATYVGATFRVIPLDKGKNWVSGGGRVIPLGELTKTTDSTGYAEIEVYQSSFTHPYPSGSDSLKYNISITFPGLSSWAQFRFVAPDTGSQYQIGVLE